MSYSNGSGIMGRITSGLFTRVQKQAALNVGINAINLNDQGVFRDPKLDLYDRYFDNTQYDNLLPWDSDQGADGKGVPLRKKKPRIRIPYARTLSSIVASKLIGPSVFPSVKVEESPDDQAFWKALLEVSNLQMFLLEPMRRMINCGEIFVRFYVENNSFVKEVYDAKYCYPTFNAAGELDAVTIKYVYADSDDTDANGNPKKKWFKLDLGSQDEILYDNPEYSPGSDEPEFTAVSETKHGLGFVQGEWFTTTGVSKGYGLVSDLTDFIDEVCYSVSQSSKAVSYNQDPQLVLKEMTGDEMQTLVRSSASAWNLGKQGKAEFLESNLNGVSVGMELRDKIRLNIQDISRVVMLDPDKIVGSAQSGKAMEVLHGPLKDMVDELRLPIGKSLKALIMKMGAVNFALGDQAPLPIPAGFLLASPDFTLKWPAIFAQTLEDLQKKVALAAQAQTGGLIGPMTAIRFIAEDFGIEDVEAELQAIVAHQQLIASLNPFAGGGF